jgi:hypothetical protein
MAAARLRRAPEVADRVVALLAVSMRAMDAAQELQADFSKTFRPAQKLTREERAFMKRPRVSQADRRRFGWRVEALAILVWSLGLVKALPGLGEQIAPWKLLDAVLKTGSAAKLAKCKLRPVKLLASEREALYQAHAKVRDAELRNKKAPRGLDGDIVMERDHAIRWLHLEDDAAWDDVTCDA